MNKVFCIQSSAGTSCNGHEQDKSGREEEIDGGAVRSSPVQVVHRKNRQILDFICRFAVWRTKQEPLDASRGFIACKCVE